MINSDGATITDTNDWVDSSREVLRATPEDILTGLSTEDDVKDGNKPIISGSEPSSVSVLEDTNRLKNINDGVHANSVVAGSHNTDRVLSYVTLFVSIVCIYLINFFTKYS